MAKQQKKTDNRSEQIDTRKRANVNVKALFSPRYRGVLLTFIFDIAFCFAAFWLARKAMFNQVSVSVPLNYKNFEIPIMIIMTGIPVCMLALFNCYNVVWKFAGRIEFIKFVASYVMSYCVLLIMKAVLFAAFNVQLWGTQILLYVFLSLVFTSIPRFSNMLIGYFKHVQRGNFAASDKKPLRTVIYGAGNIGAVLNNRFIANTDEGYMPVAFMDDDADKQGRSIGGNLVAGGLDNVEQIIEDYSPDMFVIAITDITKSRLKDIYERISKYNIPIKMLPPISDANAAANASLALRDIKIESLLGRDEFKVKTELVDMSVKDKVVMVTGGAGSIGSELCRQALTFGCKHLVIFDQNENGMFNIDQEFQKKFDTSRYSLIMGTVREAGKLAEVLNRFKPETVFHAAAYKHVPMMEIAPTEAIKNNVFGTKNLIEQCQKAGVKRFVLISTDKAVNPANVMGASKRLAEMLVQTRAEDGDMQMAAVRFGNVLGSSGSVIPTFLRQIQEGGPVTVTDRNIKRYFMTIPEAVRLVLQTGALASSGEVFVLDMGEPVYIYDLACNLIRLNGLVPNKDIQIVISGLRPGEKLFEELRYDQEKVDQTMHEGIFVTKLEAIDRAKFDKDLAELKKIAEKEDEVGIEKKVFEVVPRAAREQALKERESSLRAADAEAKMTLAAAAATAATASDAA
ncbi:MAG: polysaccharide biosynthesis protein [Clostridiales bacterium]|nr:polysaccharide biosynthesis protein [Clostridiales bacterium]